VGRKPEQLRSTILAAPAAPRIDPLHGFPGIQQDLPFPGGIPPDRNNPAVVTEERLRKAMSSGESKVSTPGEEHPDADPGWLGNMADTKVVTFSDGSKWVRKRSR